MTTTTEEKTAAVPVANEGTEWIPVKEICRNPNQPRRHFDMEWIAELALSLEEHGQLQPIALLKAETPDPDDDVHLCGYRIILGECRWRAAQSLGWESIEAKVYEGLEEAEAHVLALVENIDRAALNPMEEAEGFADLKTKYGWTQERIAERFKRSRGRVSNLVRLLDLPEDVKEAIRAGQLTSKHGEALLQYKDFPPVCSAIARIAIAEALTGAVLRDAGIPNSWQLCSEGLIKRVDPDEFGIHLDETNTRSESKKLLSDIPGIWVEFDDDSESDLDPETEFEIDGIFTLDPVAFDAWAGERTKQIEAAAREATEPPAGKGTKKKAKSGGDDSGEPAEPPLLSTLPVSSYRMLTDVPASLRKEIPAESIGEAIDWRDKKVKICTDPQLVDRLKKRGTVAKNKKARAELDAAFANAIENVKAIDQVRAADLAVIATWAVGWGASLVQGAKRLGLKASAANVAKLSPLQIIQVVLLSRLEGQYTDARRISSPIPKDMKPYAGDVKKRLKQMETEASAAKKKKAAKKSRKTAKGKAST